MAASSQADTATPSAALLNQQIEAARHELALLRSQVAQARNDIAEAPAEALREAKELLGRAQSDARLAETVAL